MVPTCEEDYRGQSYGWEVQQPCPLLPALHGSSSSEGQGQAGGEVEGGEKRTPLASQIKALGRLVLVQGA